MARVELDTTLFRATGDVAASATAFVRLRGSGTAAEVYSAATGGSLLGQPLTADAAGRLAGWVAAPAGGGLDIVYTIDGVAYTQPLDAPSQRLEWTDVTYLNSWGNYAGSGGYQASYTKTAEGLVIVRGLVERASASTADIFVLPAGFRPTATQRISTLANGALGVLQIGSGGGVSLLIGSHLWASLAPIHFAVA